MILIHNNIHGAEAESDELNAVIACHTGKAGEIPFVPIKYAIKVIKNVCCWDACCCWAAVAETQK